MLAALLCLLALQAPPDTALPFKPRPVLDSLCGQSFFGRGYVQHGGAKAAWYIQQQFLQLGLRGANLAENGAPCFEQPFPMQVNTFPAEATLTLGGKESTLGKTWLPDAASPSAQGAWKALPYDSLSWPLLAKNRQKKAALIFRSAASFASFQRSGQPAPGLALVRYSSLPAWTVEDATLPYPKVLLTDSLPPGQQVRLQLDSRVETQTSRNLVGLVPGTAQPDSFLIVGAHYDHLGGIGPSVYFPGANDNASGITLLLELAAAVARHPLRYSVLFVAFGGEEAGLKGSQHFVQQAPVPLSRVRFMLNLDLMGSGEEGATAVNAPAVQFDFNLLQAENTRLAALPGIKPRRNAPNSDHYPFTLANVPALFCFLRGPYAHYHSVDDRPRPELTLAGFAGSYKLFSSFLRRLSGDTPLPKPDKS